MVKDDKPSWVDAIAWQCVTLLDPDFDAEARGETIPTPRERRAALTLTERVIYREVRNGILA